MAVALEDLSRGVINAMELRCPGLTMPVVSLLQKSEHDYSVVVFPVSEQAEAVTRLRTSAKNNDWLTGSDAPLNEAAHTLIVYHSPAAIAFATENDLAVAPEPQAG